MKSRNPDNELLCKHAPQHVWKVAHARAEASSNHKFMTGAVIFSPKTGQIHSRGWAHPLMNTLSSRHAEDHALMRLDPNIPGSQLVCLIVTIGENRNWAVSSRPCALCAHKLHRRGVESVIYAERDNAGDWVVNEETVESLIARSPIQAPSYGLTARKMRIAAAC